jgi:hypothetical protein
MPEQGFKIAQGYSQLIKQTLNTTSFNHFFILAELRWGYSDTSASNKDIAKRVSLLQPGDLALNPFDPLLHLPMHGTLINMEGIVRQNKNRLFRQINYYISYYQHSQGQAKPTQAKKRRVLL